MKIFAHRGASGYAPENTISAIKHSLSLGCKNIEIDVQLTNDEELIVHHDYRLGRTSDGVGLVKDLTLKEIKHFDAGSWYDDKYLNEEIPSLREVFEMLPNDAVLNIEIKGSYDNSLISEKVIELIEEMNMVESVIISSFNHKILNDIYKLNSDIKLSLLVYSRLLEISEYIKYLFPLESVNLSIDLVDEAIVKEIKETGTLVYVYTVNELNELNNLKNIGVDGIFTNYPDIINKNK